MQKVQSKVELGKGSYGTETGAKEQYRLFLLKYLINGLPFLVKRYL